MNWNEERKKGRKHANWLGIYGSSLVIENKHGNWSMALEMEKEKKRDPNERESIL